MEASDPFATAAPGGAIADDPFADPPAGDIAAEIEAEPTGDIPQVDREGHPVEAPAPAEGADPAAAAAPVVDEDEQPVAPPQTPAPAQAPVESASDHMAGEAPAQPAAEPAEAPQEPAEEPAAPEPAPEPAAAEPEGDAPEPASPANGTGSRGGKGEMRHYKCLYQTGAKQWTEFPLDGELPEGLKVVNVEGEAYYEARNNDHATRIAYALLGTPQEGATVWPVPRGAFKPKRVKPAPPKPESTRLVIS